MAVDPIDPGTTVEHDSEPQRQTERFDEAAYYDWVLRQFGYPDVDVELTEDNVKDALKDALALYSKNKPRRVTEAFVSGEPLSIYFFRTLGVRGVWKVELQGISEGLSAPNIEAQLLSGSFAYYGVAAPKYDLRYYEYARQWAAMASRELSSEKNYRLSDDKKAIYIYTPGRGTRVTLTLTLDHVDPSTVPSTDQDWFRDYVLARCKIPLGRKRSKFDKILGANKDIGLDGTRLLDEAKEEIKELTEKIERRRLTTGPSWG